MYQITCPNCRTNFDPAPIRNGMAECPNCDQRMRVQLPDAPPPEPAPRRRTGVGAAAPPKRRTGVDEPLVLELAEEPEPEPARAGRGRLLLVLFIVFGLGGVMLAGVVGIIAVIVLNQEPTPADTRIVELDTKPADTRPAPDTRPVNDTRPFVPPNPPLETRPQPPIPEPKKEERVLPNLPISSLTDEQVTAKMLRSCAWILANDGTTTHTGSGVLVDTDQRLVLTSERVANELCTSIDVVFPAYRAGRLVTDNDFYRNEIKAGNGQRAKLVRTDRRRDLALVQLPALPEGVSAMRLSQRGVSPGQKVHTVAGNPRGNPGQWLATSGTVHQIGAHDWQYDDGFRRSAEVIASQIPLNALDGGGPVVDARAALVGVNAPGSQAAPRAGHIEVGEVRDFLKTHYKAAGRNWVEDPEPDPVAVGDADMKLLQQALKHENADVRRRAAVMLGDLGPSARPAVPELLARFRKADEKDEVRQACRAALGEVGAPGREHIPELTEALGDSDSLPVRLYALDAFGKLGPEARPAIGTLLRAVRDKQTEVRRGAVAVLGKIGPAGRNQSYSPLVELLKDRETEVRAAAARALTALGKPDDIEANTLKDMLTDRTVPREARSYAAWALGEMGAAQVPALTEALKTDPEPAVLSEAARALGAQKVKSKEAGQALAKAVAHSDREVRVNAAVALGQIGMDATTLPGLVKALASDDAMCRGAVMSALPPMGALIKDPPRFDLPPEAVAQLKPVLANSEPIARAVAAYLLGTLGEQAAPAVPELKQALSREKNAMAAREIVCALAEIGPAAKDAAPELREVMKDTSDETVLLQRCAALALLRITEKEDAKPAYAVLAKAVELKNAAMPEPVEKEVHERAKKALIKGGSAASAALVRAYQASLLGTADDKKEARKTAFQVIAKIGRSARLGPNQASDDLWKLLNLVISLGGNADDLEVVQAAREAATAVYARK